jgi:hypothetical protein
MAFFKEQSDLSSRGTRLPGAWDGEAWEADCGNAQVPEHMEFLAERLDEKSWRGVRWIIGTPIYVARVSKFSAPVRDARKEALRRFRADLGQGRPCAGERGRLAEMLPWMRPQPLGKPSFPRTRHPSEPERQLD